MSTTSTASSGRRNARFGKLAGEKIEKVPATKRGELGSGASSRKRATKKRRVSS
jgi:hypothetical protein